MANKDKLTKVVKRLKKKMEQQSIQLKKAETKITKLQKKLDAKEQKILRLKAQPETGNDTDHHSKDEIFQETTGDKKAIIDHKNAWKRHTYLRDRYEQHMVDGHDKDSARLLANKDLTARYGQEVGFTQEQLGDILS